MLRTIPLVLLVVAGAHGAPAQDPSRLPVAALGGRWVLDATASDVVPADILRKVGAERSAVPGPANPVMLVDGKLLYNGKIGYMGVSTNPLVSTSETIFYPADRTASFPVRSYPPASMAAPAPTASQVALFMNELAPAMLTIDVGLAATGIASDHDASVAWTTDGEKYLNGKQARTAWKPGKGTMRQSSWWRGTLQTVLRLGNGANLSRDFVLGRDGQTLDIHVATRVDGRTERMVLHYIKQGPS